MFFPFVFFPLIFPALSFHAITYTLTPPHVTLRSKLGRVEEPGGGGGLDFRGRRSRTGARAPPKTLPARLGSLFRAPMRARPRPLPVGPPLPHPPPRGRESRPRRRAVALALLSLASSSAAATPPILHPPSRPPLFLLHGSLVGGWIWRYPRPGAPGGVAGLLEASGAFSAVHTPTLPGHAPDDGPAYTPARAAVTTADCVAYLTRYLEGAGASPRAPAVVVAHSYGGVYLSELLSALPPGTIAAAVWANAWVLAPGESFADCALTGRVDRVLARVPIRRWPVLAPLEAAVARRLYFNDMQGQANASAIARDVYDRSVFEPAAPAFDAHPLPHFAAVLASRRHAPRVGYILFDNDATGPPSQWLGFADRLARARARPGDGSGHAPIPVARVAGGGHVAMVSRPAATAAAVLELVGRGEDVRRGAGATHLPPSPEEEGGRCVE